tara:strand:- start:318 stop:1109 length:792 start_codon:yes stop_codon:yes gene_type:complete
MFKEIFVRVIIFIAKTSVIGRRGKFRKFLISIILMIVKNSDNMNFQINGVPFKIYFDTDFKSIFGNYNLREIKFLIHNLKKDGTFLDIGANYGYYSQTISFHNLTKNVLSVEPNTKLVSRIKDNFSILLDHKKNVSPIVVENVAVSNNKYKAFLNLSSGLGRAFLENKFSSKSVKVSCDTLKNIILRNNIKKISGMKIDIEGHEDKALLPFFEEVNKDLYPEIILIEHTSNENWSLDIISYLKNIGYKETFRTKANMALKFNN